MGVREPEKIRFPAMCSFLVLPLAWVTVLSAMSTSTTAATASPRARHSVVRSDSSPHLRYMTYYGCEPTTQAGHTNLCITHNSSLLLDAHAANMSGMLQVTWAFFRNAVPPRVGLQLREDYQEGWDSAWSGAPGSSGCDGVWSARPCIPLRNLSLNGVAMGVFLGDELLGAGVHVTELTLAAEAVKASWPTGVVCVYSVHDYACMQGSDKAVNSRVSLFASR